MKTIARTISFSTLLLYSNAVGLSQRPDDSLRNSEPGGAKTTANGAAVTSQTLDDIRTALKKKSAETGGMPAEGMMGSGGMSMSGGMMGGYGDGMGGGAGMMGPGMGGGMGSMMGGGMDGGMGGMEPSAYGAPTEKQLLAQLIQQLRGRLGSKKFKRTIIEKQLQSALHEYFNADMQERVREFDRVKARVTEMESKLQRRLDSESEIVDLQLKQMLHKADGLDFAVPDGGGGDYGPGGMGGMSGMSEGSMGSSYGGEMGMSTAEGEPNLVGYDSSFNFTHIQRLDPRELDASDPLKSYADSTTTALPYEQAKTDDGKLKTILHAFHLFETRFHHLPKSSNRHAKSDPPHSWRVALLPLIGEGKLYNEYQFDQPWDSAQNLRVAAKMPEMYRSGQGKQNATQFMMIVGGGAFDSSSVPPRMMDITDGTSNTIALIQSDHDVAWTKPEDVAYTASGPLPGLSKARLIGIVDGSTKNLPKVKDNDFRALITRAGGEQINLTQP